MKKLLARGSLVAVLAAFLSVAMVTPAVAEGEWTPSEKITGSGGTNYKYSFDYASREYVGGSQWSYNSQPVSGQVHPAQTYYERKQAARAAAAAEKPLVGKIIEPGKTVVRAPSTYGAVTKFATAVGAVPGWSRLLGGIGVGMGGTSLAPANHAQIAINQGVSAECANGTGACTADETKKKFLIGSCGNLTGAQSCDAIGAVGTTGETDMQKWFRDEALPFLDDLWASITGQKNGDDTPRDEHQEVSYAWGCRKQLDFEHTPDTNTGKFHVTSTRIVAGRPTSPLQQAGYWDASCSPAKLAEVNANGAVLKSTCVDSKGSTSGTGVGYSVPGEYGMTYGFVGNYVDTTTGDLKVSGLCTSRNTVNTPVRLAMVEIINTMPQTSFVNPTAGNYVSLDQYSRWINPNLDFQEDTKITTNWQCKTNDGSYTHSFSKSVKSTAAIASPVCPPGSQLMNHEIKKTDGIGGNATTLDAGAANPTETAKYPGCFQPGQDGCTLNVHVDGQLCNTSRTECQTWPQINAIQPSRVKCYWGSYVVKTSDCNVISNGYKSETGVVFDPKANTWIAIDAFGNPIAPNPQPWNPTNPNPSPGVQPGTSTTTPGTGGSTSPIPQTGTNPSTGGNCNAPQWSWNPVEWVYSPVVCALKDAFVPKLDVQAKISEIQTIAMDRPPMNWLTPAPMVGPGGGGCPNWVVSVPGFSQNVVCESSFTAAIVGARVPLFGLVATAMVWPLMRSLWYAAIPILRVSPASSK